MDQMLISIDGQSWCLNLMANGPVLYRSFADAYKAEGGGSSICTVLIMTLDLSRVIMRVFGKCATYIV